MHKCQSTSDSSRNPSVYAQKADFRDCFCLSGPRGPVTFLLPTQLLTCQNLQPVTYQARKPHYLAEFQNRLLTVNPCLALFYLLRRSRHSISASGCRVELSKLAEWPRDPLICFLTPARAQFCTGASSDSNPRFWPDGRRVGCSRHGGH